MVREPQDSARVHPVIRAVDDSVGEEAWRPLTDLITSDPISFYAFYGAYLREEPSALSPMTSLLQREHNESGFAKALRVVS